MDTDSLYYIIVPASRRPDRPFNGRYGADRTWTGFAVGPCRTGAGSFWGRFILGPGRCEAGRTWTGFGVGPCRYGAGVSRH